MRIEEKGVKIAFITLHVGLGTFRPVKVDKIEEHTCMRNFIRCQTETADTINEVKENNGSVIAVGTTSITNT